MNTMIKAPSNVLPMRYRCLIVIEEGQKPFRRDESVAILTISDMVDFMRTTSASETSWAKASPTELKIWDGENVAWIKTSSKAISEIISSFQLSYKQPA